MQQGKINIGASLFELLLVALGVFLALAADNWQQEQRQKRLRKQYLSRLQSDLRADRQELLGSMNTNRHSIQLTDTFLKRLLSKPVVASDSLVKLFLQLGSFSLFRIQGTSYSSPSALEPLEDDSLITKLAVLNRSLEYTRVTEQFLLDQLKQYYAPLVINHLRYTPTAPLPVQLTEQSLFYQDSFTMFLLGYQSACKQKQSQYEEVDSLLQQIQKAVKPLL